MKEKEILVFIRPAYIRDTQAQVSGSPLKRKTKKMTMKVMNMKVHG